MPACRTSTQELGPNSTKHTYFGCVQLCTNQDVHTFPNIQYHINNSWSSSNSWSNIQSRSSIQMKHDTGHMSYMSDTISNNCPKRENDFKQTSSSKRQRVQDRKYTKKILFTQNHYSFEITYLFGKQCSFKNHYSFGNQY